VTPFGPSDTGMPVMLVVLLPDEAEVLIRVTQMDVYHLSGFSPFFYCEFSSGRGRFSCSVSFFVAALALSLFLFPLFPEDIFVPPTWTQVGSATNTTDPAAAAGCRFGFFFRSFPPASASYGSYPVFLSYFHRTEGLDSFGKI